MTELPDEILEKYPVIKRDVSLADYSWFRIGGPADYFAAVREKKSAGDMLSLCADYNIPVFILGSGSNLLFHDNGFRGLVMKIEIDGIEFDDNRMICGAGVELSRAMNAAAAAGLGGWEGLYGIPGTTGGAVRGNVGAYGNEIAQFTFEVEYADGAGNVSVIRSGEARFDYRHSLFKEQFGVITSAVFELKETDTSTAKKKMEKILEERNSKHPSRMTAGCFFKNPREYGKPAALLIEEAGLKGLKEGGAEVSSMHANFIVNSGNATSADVVALSFRIKQRVFSEYGVTLHEEVQIVPEFIS